MPHWWCKKGKVLEQIRGVPPTVSPWFPFPTLRYSPVLCIFSWTRPEATSSSWKRLLQLPVRSRRHPEAHGVDRSPAQPGRSLWDIEHWDHHGAWAGLVLKSLGATGLPLCWICTYSLNLYKVLTHQWSNGCSAHVLGYVPVKERVDFF